jgi:TonB family protein
MQRSFISAFPPVRVLAFALVFVSGAAWGFAQNSTGNGGQAVVVPEAEARHAVKYKVEPEYPATARQFHISGEVVAQFTVGTDGKVESVDDAKGNLVLAQAVKSALRKWVFTPFQANGKAVRVRSSMTFEFKL